MKSTFLILITGLIMTTTTSAQNISADISQTIINFASAGDRNNAEELSNYLDPNYRIIMNQLFGSKELSIMNREVYLDKIKNKEFGGDKREVTINSLLINGNTACALVTLKGEKSTFISLINLAQNHQGKWQLTSDTPIIP